MAIDKTQATKCTKLIYVSPEANSNKFWCGWVMPSGDLYVEYGRINYLPRNHIYSCGSVTAASRKLASLVREKARKGYQEAILEADDVRRNVGTSRYIVGGGYRSRSSLVGFLGVFRRSERPAKSCHRRRAIAPYLLELK